MLQSTYHGLLAVTRCTQSHMLIECTAQVQTLCFISSPSPFPTQCLAAPPPPPKPKTLTPPPTLLSSQVVRGVISDGTPVVGLALSEHEIQRVIQEVERREAEGISTAEEPEGQPSAPMNLEELMEASEDDD